MHRPDAMRYWRDDNFRGLSEVAAAIAAEPELREYAAYLDLREKGLRKPAFERLGRFVDAARGWSFDQRKRFVNWLMAVSYARPEITDLIPVPLRTGLILPMLDEWVDREPDDPIPFRWRGQFRSLDEALADFRRAIALEPSEQIARTLLLEGVIGAVDFSVHEMPTGYIGRAERDLHLLDEAQTVLLGLADPGPAQALAERVKGLREIVRAYLDFRASGDAGSYLDWARAHGRPASFGVSRRYFYAARPSRRKDSPQ